MTPKDKNYLSLQFWHKIFTKSGREFQNFFENIMQKAYIDFQKIKPYGNEGDEGNDGYIKKLGNYYQVYAPENPQFKEAEAAKKLKNDFELLKKGWDQISTIKNYFFVYNDKNIGSIKRLEEAITNLSNENSDIVFEIINAQKLEKIFLNLNEVDLLNLGFDIDSRKTIANAYEYLKQIEYAFDIEDANLAFLIHGQVEYIIKSIKDEDLDFEYELLKARCFPKLEKVNDAIDCYKKLLETPGNDPRPILYYAELLLFEKKIEQNKDLLEKADKNHWLYTLDILVRKSNLNEEIDLSSIDETLFPNDPDIKSNFYRLYSLFYERSNNKTKADEFINKAIFYNKNKFINYLTKLSFLEKSLFTSSEANENLSSNLDLFVEEIEKIEKKFLGLGNLRIRYKATLLYKKLIVFRIKEDIDNYQITVSEVFALALNCHFDTHIENILVGILVGFILPEEDFNKLILFLNKTDIEISNQLSQILLLHFIFYNLINSEGKKFFEEKNLVKYLSFIESLENERNDEVISYLRDDSLFAVGIVNSLKGHIELREQIIKNLSTDDEKIKEILLISLYNEKNDKISVIENLTRLDISSLRNIEIKELLKISKKYELWEVEIKLIERMLKIEKDLKILLDLKLESFNAHLSLKDYLGAIKVGKEVLNENTFNNNFNRQNMEAVLAHTIQSYFKRGEDDSAHDLLSTYKFLSISPEFKISIEIEVYLKNNFPLKALDSLVSAVKLKKRLSPEEYASLFYFIIRIDNQIIEMNEKSGVDQKSLKLDSLKKIELDCFVKISNQDIWYYIGEDEELDATKIDNNHANYNLFINKWLGDSISFSAKYSSNAIIENVEIIFSIEQYILWQSKNNFEKLSKEERWDGARMIEVPNTEDSIDTKYLENFFRDDQERRNPLFELYCTKNIPLALLALNEGGLGPAIGRIVRERKGFIRCSSGMISEMEQQRDIAKKVIDEKLAFYIDGTSALFLSEIGYLEKIYCHLPNLKVPQSVIAMLLFFANRFRTTSKEGGTLGYARGQIFFSGIDKETNKKTEDNFRSSIRILESKPDNIVSISSANKMNCLSENKIHPELSDACILARTASTPILTEDYLFLQMNEFETKKKAPEYFSAISLLRVLYDFKKISFSEYLLFFGYLASYRSRFLSLNADDIKKAIFGDGIIFNVQPQNIRNFYFALTLSEEYGVPFGASFNVLLAFFHDVILDDSITVDITEIIFAEILDALPKEKNKRDFGQMIIDVSERMIQREHKLIMSSTVQEKINRLKKLIDIFEEKLWLPSLESISQLKRDNS